MAVLSDDLVTIGKIGRPFGVKGDVTVRSLSDVPGRFDRLSAVSVVEATGLKSDKTVTGVRRTGSSYIVHFDGVSTPEEAGILRGGLIQVPREDRPNASNEVLYECDVIGMSVVDQLERRVGQVKAIWELPGHSVIVVHDGEREVLIPAARHFVTEVDVPRQRMTVRLIDGMIEQS